MVHISNKSYDEVENLKMCIYDVEDSLFTPKIWKIKCGILKVSIVMPKFISKNEMKFGG